MSITDRVAGRLRRAWLARLPQTRLQDMLARRRGAVFLCYHSLSPDLDAYPYRTSAAAFDRHMALLREVFDILPAAEAVAALRGGGLHDRPRPVAVVCFDDGYRDNWEVATPILERYGVPASLYAARSLIREGGDTFLSEADLQRLAAHPLWQVGAHGLTHSVMSGLLLSDQRREMQASRDWLADLLGRAPAGFAYPMGDISPSAVGVARSIYDHALSTDRRLANTFDPFQVRRACPRQQDDGHAAFLRLLWQAPWE